MKKKYKKQSLDENIILQAFTNQHKPLRISSLISSLKLPLSSKKEISKLLAGLVSQKRLSRLPGGLWTLPENSSIVTGKFLAGRSGGGKVRVLSPENYPHADIFISPFQTAGAWNNDLVKVNILPTSGGGKGKILEIVERANKEVPAILEKRSHRSLIFRAADAKLPHRFLVRPEEPQDLEIKPGDLANLEPIKKIEGNPLHGELWEAKIVKFLGPADRISGQEAIVKTSQKAPGAFPPLALAQAEAMPPFPSPLEISQRRDLRDIPFVTIDGADARDFDDAIHVEKTASGWILRVAIADVSHYVKPDATPGSLDAEALERGNSWYFPRSVEPMLPPNLSNGLCSLRPDEDRLAMLVEISFSSNGDIIHNNFAPIVMRSAGRLVYDDVAAFYAGDSKSAVPDRFRPMLNDARELYKILSQKRRQQGCLDFILPEAEYKFDESGKLVHMGVAERNDANMLIEEFMIAANEAVAEFLESKKIAFLYRDHPQPEREKLHALYETLKKTALEILPPDIEVDGEPNPHAIQKILMAAHGTSKEFVVNRLCLRSMAQARYQPENLGHFGLASKAYCHFTSPIRRYADLLVHRALKNALGLTKYPALDTETLSEIGNQLNGLERRAIECERDMTKRLACLALEGKEGEILAGTISGVTDFGLFVEFVNMPAEGLMRMEELGDAWFTVDQSTQSVSGGGKTWRLGQPVKCRLLSVELDKQEIRLSPADVKKTAKNTKRLKKGLKKDFANKKGQARKMARKKEKNGIR